MLMDTRADTLSPVTGQAQSTTPPYAGGLVKAAPPDFQPDTSPRQAKWRAKYDRKRERKQERERLNAERAELVKRLKQIDAALQILKPRPPETPQERYQRLATLAPDGSETPDQTRWINEYRDSADPFAEYITASRHHAVHGVWPDGVKPQVDFEGVPVWRVKWLTSQRSFEKIEQRREHTRSRRQQQREALLAEMATIDHDTPLPVRVTTLGEVMLSRKNRGAA